MIKVVENNILSNIKSSLAGKFGVDKGNLSDGIKLKKEVLTFIFDKIRKKSDFLAAISYLEVSSESGKALDISFSDPWFNDNSPRQAKEILKTDRDLFKLKRVKSDHKISIDQIENIGMNEKDLFAFLEKKMTENEMYMIEKHLLQGEGGDGTGKKLIKGFLQKVKELNPNNFKEKSPLNGKILIGNQKELINLGSFRKKSDAKVELDCINHGLEDGVEFYIYHNAKYDGPYLVDVSSTENKIVFKANYTATNMANAKLVVSPHYNTLDAFVSDLKKLIDVKKRRNMKVFLSGDLMQERITYYLNKNESVNQIKDAKSLDLYIANMPCIVPNEMPSNTIFVASQDALALYVGKNSGRFAIEEDIENDNFKFFRSWKLDAVVQDSNAIAIAKNVYLI